MTDRIYLYGEELAADDIEGMKHLKIKICIGPDNIANDISLESPIPVSDLLLEVAKGTIPNYKAINKFGRTDNADNGIATDVWDRANSTDDQAIWIAPTQTRIHNIASSSSDDVYPNGNGARTLLVYGLSNWNTPETSQLVEMNGISDVPIGPFVIIHRMKVVSKGATSTNVGKITATAQVDGTVTSQINASKGQTQMIIYGVPSNQTLFLTNIAATINGTDKIATATLFVNPEPDMELTNFLVKHTLGLQTDGNSYVPVLFRPYKRIPGPAIVKIQIMATVNNTDISAWFDGILSNN